MTHVVRPDRLIAGWWAVVTLLVTSGAVWLVGDSDLHWFYLALLTASVPVFAWFAVQALAPGLTTLTLDQHGLRGRFLWKSVDVPWTQVHVLRVDRLVGETVMEIITTDRRTHLVPVPLGASIPRLHEALAATLGHGTPAPAQPSRPATPHPRS